MSNWREVGGWGVRVRVGGAFDASDGDGGGADDDLPPKDGGSRIGKARRSCTI